MSIMERLARDMVQATKARDSERLGVIRYLRSEAKNREIDLGRELKDEDAIEVLSRVARKHREAIDQFSEGGRPELVEREKRQLAVVETYLPESLSEQELAEIVDAAIEETGAEDPRGFGLVMKSIMPRVKGRADGKVVKDLVQQRLSGSEEE